MKAPHPELSRAPGARLAQIQADIADRPEIAGFQGYEKLVNNNQAKRAEFIEAQDGNPRLTYALLAGEQLQQLISLGQSAEASLVTLIGSERNTQIEALFEALEYREAEIFMIYMSSRMLDESLPREDRAEAAEWYKLANEALYGVPEQTIFSAVARQRLLPHINTDFSTDPQALQLQYEINQRIGRIDDEGFELYQPNQVNKERFAELIHERFDGMLAHVSERYDEGDGTEIQYTAQETIEAIRVALDYIGATELGWRCEEVPNKELLSVSAHQKLVEVGEHRAPMDAAELRAKIAHEVGVHVVRSVNAERAGWPSAAYGQQRYLDFEESFANKVGEVYWGEGVVAAPEYRYMIASFAYGLDNHPPRDMRECYEIMWRTIALDTRKPGQPLNIEAAQKTAYLQCNRMFRGTPFDIPGLIMSKDLSYQRGDEVVNPVIDLIESQDDLDLLFAGKLDPTLGDHLPIAEAIAPDNPLAVRIRRHFALAA